MTRGTFALIVAVCAGSAVAYAVLLSAVGVTWHDVAVGVGWLLVGVGVGVVLLALGTAADARARRRRVRRWL